MPINKIKERISAILNENDDHLDALIITDNANLTYVTGVQLQLLASIPYLSVILFWSKNGRTLICPSALA
ncbi:MAG TPA: aminopeptidase P family N-terminal domain-containing protein, partial [Flexilinea sp.]|nr:aminopeptidase P family N-terminal domain-containing protein [Flexilinea sp.]